jgi:hypothetical protein
MHAASAAATASPPPPLRFWMDLKVEDFAPSLQKLDLEVKGTENWYYLKIISNDHYRFEVRGNIRKMQFKKSRPPITPLSSSSSSLSSLFSFDDSTLQASTQRRFLLSLPPPPPAVFAPKYGLGSLLMQPIKY